VQRRSPRSRVGSGCQIDSFGRILDFGCGCGRTLQWLTASVRGAELHGTDIDGEAIAWCRRALEPAAFSVNRERPPLDYPSSYFDLVYAVSVFTHLPEEAQLEWLPELRRLTATGGVVALTVRGPSRAGELAPGERDELRARGFVFTKMPLQFQNLFPSWYQTATITEEYVRATWSRWFEVEHYLPQALDGSQDVVVLRKRS
jgi:cyclopropane fatty-acyl-phospholipid synthase-like methyltransferase